MNSLVKQRLQTTWHFIRSLATDDAYDLYLTHHRQAHGDTAPLDRRSFYLREQQDKWHGVRRCC